MKLRDYQQCAIRGVCDTLRTHKLGTRRVADRNRQD
jgi:hypothetical protein